MIKKTALQPIKPSIILLLHKHTNRTIILVLLLCSYSDIYATINKDISENWIKKADQFKKASQYDSARFYLQKAINYSKLKKDVNHQIDYLLLFAETHYWQSNYSQALKNVLHAKSLVTPSTPCKNRLNVELYVFRIQYALNEKDNALQGIKKNLPEIEKCGDSNLLYLNHYYHGVIYTETGIADSAIYHLNIANKIALKQQDFEGASKCHSVYWQICICPLERIILRPKKK